MKKALFLLILGVSLPVLLAAENRDSRNIKLGAALGYPLLVTAGFPVDRIIEINAFVGYDYNNISHSGTQYAVGGVYVGGNVLFTLMDLNLAGDTFPLSVGPHFSASFGFAGNARFDVLANLRTEFTFPFPLNLYVELGLGVGINTGNAVSPVVLAGVGAVGVRYVFAGRSREEPQE